MSKTYAVASAKGGVGKTTTVANLGTALASAGADVVVVDADIGMANLGGALGIAPDGPTLHTVLTGDADVAAAIYEGPAGLAVVPGSTSLEDYRDADPTRLGELVEDLETDYDYVLLDTGAGLSHDAVLPLGLGDEVLLVSTAQREALGDTDKSRELVGRLDGTVAGLVLTRTHDGDEPSDPVDAEVLERVPDDPTVDEAITAGEPIVRYDPASPAAAAYRRLAATLTGLEIPDGGAGATADEEATDDEVTGVDGDGDEAADEATSGPDGSGEDAEQAEPDEAQADENDLESESDEDADANPDEDADANPDEDADANPDEGTAGDAVEKEPAESDENAADEGEEGADAETDAEGESADESENESVIEEAEPRKSVGPRRDEHVPVRDDEELEDDEGPSTPEDGEKKKKKGFLSRLLGR